jgi:hypothetical protein
MRENKEKAEKDRENQRDYEVNDRRVRVESINYGIESTQNDKIIQ